MTNRSLSQLTSGAAVSSTDTFPDIQTAGAGPVKVTAAQIGNYVLGGSGITSTLPVARGGTGLTSLTAGRIPYGAGTSAFSSSSSLYCDGTNLGIGTSSPSSYGKLAVYGASGGISARIITGGGTISDYAQQILVAGSSANYNINMLVYGDGSGAYHYSSVPFNFGTSSSNPLIFLTNSAERMRLDNNGNIICGTAAIATNATNGFLYVPGCAGTPTGTPTTVTGRSPIVVDTTNNKLYFYSGGQWRDAGP